MLNPNYYAIFQPQLHDTLLLAYTYLTLNTRSYIAMGSGIHIMTNAGFRVEEYGVHQRAVPSGYLYSLKQNRAIMQNHHERVVEAEGGGV